MKSNEENIFIYVPQGGYAEINENTPSNVKGLLTVGMSPCCHVMVSNSSTGHTILCHADSSTNLEHPISGVPGWIRKVCPNNDFTNLIVNVGENKDQPRFTATEEENHPIYDQVASSLYKAVGNIDKLMIFNVTAGEGYSLSIDRGTNVITKEQHEDMDAMFDVRNRHGVRISQLLSPDPMTNKDIPFETSIINARSYADNINRLKDKGAPTLRFPPICVFEGNNDRFLSIDEIGGSYTRNCSEGDPIIDWGRVKRYEGSTPGSSVNGKNGYNSDTSESIESTTQLRNEYSGGTSVLSGSLKIKISDKDTTFLESESNSSKKKSINHSSSGYVEELTDEKCFEGNPANKIRIGLAATGGESHVSSNNLSPSVGKTSSNIKSQSK